ncbi:MAG: endonuclease/exonuclease/phosphatase family protein [Dehalococcoidales bacterium]|jgi:endonuclease/exonuclease/phosphatase family metal-dependent hydrolase|nr:endonuclease/exonuclease/phosphatase family protein [Dehalococcoidales bacterium]
MEIRASLTKNNNWLLNRPIIFELIFPAIVAIFGLQSIRVLVSSLTWTLGDRFAVSAPLLGIIALGVFCPIFLSGFIKRILGYQRSIIIITAILALSRLLLQTVWIEPLVNTVFAIIATLSFVLFIPLYIDRVRNCGKLAPALFALGLLLGVAADSAIYGVHGTYDIAWNNGFWSVLITLLLTTVLFLILYNGRLLLNIQNYEHGRPTLPITWPLISIGPFLFLQMQIFQNIARLTTVTGWETPLVFSWIMLGHLLGITFAAWFIFHPPAYTRAIIYLLAFILLLSTIFPTPTGLLAGLYFLLGQISLSILIYFILLYSTSPGKEAGSKYNSNTAIPTGIGILIMAAFILGYYATYQIKLPFDNHIFEPVAAFIITACVIPIGFAKTVKPEYDFRLWFAPAITVILLLFSFASMVTFQKPVPANTSYNGYINFMCYNLHNGFNTKGHLNMEELAKNIEAFNPDIVALQEISRGWLVNGRVDMIEWLSIRLDMPYVYGATAGPMWGNAILSRFEITNAENFSLPSEDLPIERGFIHATIKLSLLESIDVIATHFHHVEEDTLVRQSQASRLLEYIGLAENTIIMGDFNAVPGAEEIQMFTSAGFIDVVSLVEPPPAYTFRSDAPYQRIDYIWMSPGMEADHITIYPSTASDHLAIFAVIEP